MGTLRNFQSEDAMLQPWSWRAMAGLGVGAAAKDVNGALPAELLKLALHYGSPTTRLP